MELKNVLLQFFIGNTFNTIDSPINRMHFVVSFKLIFLLILTGNYTFFIPMGRLKFNLQN